MWQPSEPGRSAAQHRTGALPIQHDSVEAVPPARPLDGTPAIDPVRHPASLPAPSKAGTAGRASAHAPVARFDSPAGSESPVTLRPHLAMGLPFRRCNCMTHRCTEERNRIHAPAQRGMAKYPARAGGPVVASDCPKTNALRGPCPRSGKSPPEYYGSSARRPHAGGTSWEAPRGRRDRRRLAPGQPNEVVAGCSGIGRVDMPRRGPHSLDCRHRHHRRPSPSTSGERRTGQHVGPCRKRTVARPPDHAPCTHDFAPQVPPRWGPLGGCPRFGAVVRSHMCRLGLPAARG
jgi:hypothetical protein